MNFLKKLFSKKKKGTGEGQIFKDGIKTLAFEVYSGVSILHIAQVEDNGSIAYKYLFYTSKEENGKREDTLHSGVVSDLEQSRERAMAEVDKLI